MNFPDKLHLANLAINRAMAAVQSQGIDDQLFQNEWATAIAWNQHRCCNYVYNGKVQAYLYP